MPPSKNASREIMPSSAWNHELTRVWNPSPLSSYPRPYPTRAHTLDPSPPVPSAPVFASAFSQHGDQDFKEAKKITKTKADTKTKTELRTNKKKKERKMMVRTYKKKKESKVKMMVKTTTKTEGGGGRKKGREEGSRRMGKREKRRGRKWDFFLSENKGIGWK